MLGPVELYYLYYRTFRIETKFCEETIATA